MGHPIGWSLPQYCDNSTTTTIYVDDGGGDDNTGDGSSGSPYATLSKALSVASCGNIISLAAGTYNAGGLDDNLTVNSGTLTG